MWTMDEIKESITDGQRELIRDFLNGSYSEEELANIFDLKKCDRCETYNLEEDLKLSVNDDYICETCINDI